MTPRRSAVAVLLGSTLIGACSDSLAPTGEHQLQVQVSAALAQAPAAASGPTLAPGISSVEITEAVVVLGGLKLETAGLDQTVDWVLEESVVVPLDLTGQPTLAFDRNVPPGTYKELEISIDKLEVGHPEEQALIDLRTSLADVSVLVAGQILRNGTPEAFEFTAPLDIDLELPFSSALTVSEDDLFVALVSLEFDLSEWFVASGGGILDPSDPGDRSAIEAAITASIEVVKESQ